MALAFLDEPVGGMGIGVDIGVRKVIRHDEGHGLVVAGGKGMGAGVDRHVHVTGGVGGCPIDL